MEAAPTFSAPVRFDPRNVWQVGFVVIALVAVALFLRFVVNDAGSVLFTLLMAWFAALALEPAVGRLSRRMRRGAAVGLVMAAIALFAVIFVLAFGQLFVEQVAQLLKAPVNVPCTQKMIYHGEAFTVGKPIQIDLVVKGLSSPGMHKFWPVGENHKNPGSRYAL